MAKKLLFLLLILSEGFAVQAAHLKGGWMKYEYLGPTPGNASKSRYRLTVHQYLSCNSTIQQVDQTIYVGVFSGSTRLNTIAVPLTSTETPSRSDFPCVTPVQTVCYRIDIYVTTIDLDNSTNGYSFAVQRCSRIAGIINISNSGNTGVTYTTSIPGSVPGIVDAFTNTSAAFSKNDAVVVCANNSFTFPFIATDADGDSLSYRFTDGKDIQFCDPANPLINPPNPPPYPSVNYQGGFSALQPLGSSVSINAQTGIISGIAPSATGDYVVAVIVNEYRNGIKVAENRKEIHITVSGCNIPTADLPIRPATCDGFTVNFQNGSSSPSITSYNWDFGVPGITTDVSTQPTPIYTYQDTGIYTVTLTVNQGQPCVNTGTQIVRVFPGFFPGFTAAGSCRGIPFTFTDTTRTNYGVIDSHKWNFGDLTTLADTANGTPTLPVANYTYPTVGTYSVQLIVTNSKGCIDTANVDIVVNDKPQLTLPFKDTLICSIDTLQLHAISGTGLGSFVWTPNYRINNVNDPNPLVNPLVTTTYSVTLNDRGCVATDNIKVNVLDFITVDAGPDTTICRTDSVTLRPVSQALSFRWTPIATLNNPNIKNPVAKPTAASTNYIVQANLGKCQAADSIVVKTVPYPKANAGNDTTVCFGEKIILNGTIDGLSSVWLPSQLVQNPTSLNTLASPRSTTNFILVVTDTLGCPKPSRDTVLATVRPQPFVFAGNDTSIIIGQPLVFQSSASSFLSQYQWSPATGMNNTTLLRPTVVITPSLYPNGTDQIKYTLTATSAEGCTGSDDIIVKIFKTGPSIFLPSAFTPNGDGNNDIYKPILAGMQRLDYFRVFNRYGQLVYQTSAIGQGWDGRIKGNPQGSAGYVYSVQAVDYNGKVIKQSGSFLLIK